jgi:hypothetical protein
MLRNNEWIKEYFGDFGKKGKNSHEIEEWGSLDRYSRSFSDTPPYHLVVFTF